MATKSKPKSEEDVCIFETITILSNAPEYTSDNITDTIVEFKELLQSFSTERKLSYNYIGLKRLAYEIKGNSDGNYVQFMYQAKRKDIAKAEEYCNRKDIILKYITVVTNEDETCLELLESNSSKSEQNCIQEKPKQIIDVFNLIYKLDDLDLDSDSV